MKGEVKEFHPNGEEYENLDTNEEWTNLLLNISSLGMFTNGSQTGRFDLDYSLAHKSFTDYANMSNMNVSYDNLSKEEERPFIDGFLPLSYKNSLIKYTKENNLCLILQTYGNEKEIYNASWKNGWYNLTRVKFDDGKIFEGTNIQQKLEFELELFDFVTNNELIEYIKKNIMSVVIASISYGESKLFIEKINKMVRELKN